MGSSRQSVICMRILGFIFAFTTACCLAQRPKDQLRIANAAQIGISEFYQEIPFVDKGGYFIIPVKIGVETYNYIFDTGGYNTVTTEIMNRNTLPELMQVTVGSANQLKSKVKLSKIPRLYLGNIPFNGVGVFNFDFEESPVIKCYTDGGLLGKGVIKECVWQIDYENKVIRLADRVDKMPGLENSMKLNVELDNVFNPFVKVKINGQLEKFLLDFGYGGFISLTEKTAAKISFGAVTEINGEGTIGANGVNYEKTYAVKLNQLRIADCNFHHPVAFYSKSNNYNLIGSEIAKHFIVTLDFRNKVILLTPVKDTEEEIFRTFGFDLNLRGDRIYVNRIYKGLSADKKGLLLNDEISGINGQGLNPSGSCDRLFEARQLFRQAESEINLEIKRAGKIIEILLSKSELE
jgi:hypothetical protein